jgi:hypothetical protein
MAKALKNIAFTSLVACAMLLVGISCNDNCMGNSSGIPLAAFYQDENLVSLNNITVYGVGAPNDSAVVRNATVTQVYLPFRITEPECQYVFDYNVDGLENDTITFNYDIIPYFESRECGAMYNFDIKEYSYTQHSIDSVAVPSTRITNSDVVTIKIFMQ